MAIWVFAILGIVFGLPFAIRSLTSGEETPAPVASPTETVASCSGERPPANLRDPGPFEAPGAEDVDVEHIFVATIRTYCGNMSFKIDPKDAPEAARSFVYLARKRYYTGLPVEQLLAGATVFLAPDPGYQVVASGPPGTVRGDLVMLPRRSAGSFGVLTANGRLDGAKIGELLEGDTTTLVTLERLAAQPRIGTTPENAIFILQVDIQEFTRE